MAVDPKLPGSASGAVVFSQFFRPGRGVAAHRASRGRYLSADREFQVVYIRFIGTHAEYDKIKAEEV